MNARRCTWMAVSSLLLIAGCTEKSGSGRDPGELNKVIVRDEGRTIVFPEGSPGLEQIGVEGVKRGKATLSVVAPARIVATISPSVTGKERIVLFETPDITSLHSSYIQSRSNADRTSRNLARIKDMFENQAATGKDVNDAENDAALARASMVEMEGRLRALGFNPVELESVELNSVWIIADVSESEMNQIRRGEPASVVLNAFPQTVFHGRADAIGDVVDPVTRTVKIRVWMQNDHGKLLPGMFARVTFGKEQNASITLPPSAVVTVEGKNHVFVEGAPGEFHRREVTIVNSTGTALVILQGIDDNERVVTKGSMLLKGLSFGY